MVSLFEILLMMPQGSFSFQPTMMIRRLKVRSNKNGPPVVVHSSQEQEQEQDVPAKTTTTTLQSLFEDPQDDAATTRLPIMDIMDDLLRSLHATPNLILEAPPGAGKTTLVPLACCQYHSNNLKIIVVEPRRVAARSAAFRMAKLVDEQVGGSTVGYAIRGESRVSANTKIMVVTDGVLLNKLRQDPELTGVGMVILDEFHERGVGSDTALALCREAQKLVRPDLKLIVMSATLLGEYKEDDADEEEGSADDNSGKEESENITTASKLVRALGGRGECRILQSDGRQFPIDIRWAKQLDWKSTRIQPLGIILRDRKLLVETMCAAIEHAVVQAPGKGDILAFLPGVAEIRRVIQMLRERNAIGSVDVLPMYGSLPKEEQDFALFPNPKSPQRVIVSTPIAEASLTLERVTCVVDSGLRREPRCDADTGMPRLITTRCSKASATQRAGRAGRVQPGLCLRIYTEAEFDDHFLEQSPPEIASSDLSPTVLLLADWGCNSEQEILEEFPFVDAPNPELLKKAVQLLVDLKALDAREGGRFAINPVGQAIAKIPAHPRLATALVRASRDQTLLAAAVAATFIIDDEMGVRGQRDPDMASLMDTVFQKANARSLLRYAQRIGDSAKAAVQAVLDGTISPAEVGSSLGCALLPGFIDLIADRKGDASYGGSSYMLSLGRSVRLDDIRDGSQYIVVVDTSTGDDGLSRIRAFASINKEELLAVAEERETVFTVPSRGHEVRSRKVLAVGALELSSTPLPLPSAEKVAAALKDAVTNLGGVYIALVKSLHGDKHTMVDELCNRVRLARKLSEDSEWPDCFAALDSHAAGTPSDEESVLLDDLIDPWLAAAKSLKEISIFDILVGSLSPDQRRQLDQDYPVKIDAPDGSKIPVRYASAETPTASAKLQQFFGTVESPSVGPRQNRIPISLSLLSPSGKLLALTVDLPFFWKEAYPSIRAEMRGRYSKHPWPEDPLAATATRQTKNQEARSNGGDSTAADSGSDKKKKNRRKKK
jgi:ATP-dependent helicase HrpB